MNTPRHTLTLGLAALLMLTSAGCAVTRGQESVGNYIDDTAITTNVKTLLLENRVTDGTSISVETLRGTVMLSGFAKSSAERQTAEGLARNARGVVAVRNELVVRP